MMKREFLPVLALGLASMLVGGCAGTPPTPDTPVSSGAAAGGQREASGDPDAALAEAARGYERVNKKGKLYFCRRERPVGSQMYTTVCLTEAQIRQQAEDNRKVQEKVLEKGRR